MSATIVLKPVRPSLASVASGLLRVLQILLMLAGVVGIAAAFDARRVEDALLGGLQVMPVAESNVEAMSIPVSTGAVATDDPLTPRMRRALNFMARRYHVSDEALEPIFAAAESAAQAVKVDPLLVVSVIAIESRFNPFSESVVGAQGLMQVMPRYHQDKLPQGADELSFFDPVLNVQIGTRILKESIARNGGLVAGLQQFAGAMDDPDQRYAAKVLAEKARLEAAVRRAQLGTA